MKTIVHISDLHFGTEDPEIVEDLFTDIEKLNADVLLVSGDLTQRSRTRQFLAAKSFLDRFTIPKVVIPGNHDIPLYNVIKRLRKPFKRFKFFISGEDFPEYEDNKISVVGVNSVRSRRWKGGRITEKQINRLKKIFQQKDETLIKLLAVHHNLVFSEETENKKKQVRSAAILQELTASRIDLILMGHDHKTFITGLPDPDAEVYDSILIQAGTAVSRRTRSEKNSYNVLRIQNHQLEVESRSYENKSFRHRAFWRFERINGKWYPD
ncbi:MAG: metallophosphoesterase [Calditrichaeota bacterium]|nr:metallophosphoesterase [Calditrichota bacterium]RQW02786.1 MAG: metallophosphoesterase [Calditrichota bacterium]